jgi:phage baseplate assembly protein gpV
MGISNLMRREIGRADNSSARSMVGIVDAYDPNEHAVKVKYLTEVDDDDKPRISGWLRIKTASGGAGGSFVIGPSVGDQCMVHHSEGDAEGGHVSGFIHNDTDRPPVVQSGEAVITTKAGVAIKIDKDGNVSIATTSGNVAMTAQNFTFTGNVAFSGGTLKHNGHDVGSTHEHSGVTTGGGNTGAPL